MTPNDIIEAAAKAIRATRSALDEHDARKIACAAYEVIAPAVRDLAQSPPARETAREAIARHGFPSLTPEQERANLDANTQPPPVGDTKATAYAGVALGLVIDEAQEREFRAHTERVIAQSPPAQGLTTALDPVTTEVRHVGIAPTGEPLFAPAQQDPSRTVKGEGMAAFKEPTCSTCGKNIGHLAGLVYECRDGGHFRPDYTRPAGGGK